MQTPLDDFIAYKADSGSQCGNYSIDLPALQEGEQYRFHFDATKCVGCRCCEVACNEQNNNPADIKWRRVGEMEGGSFPDTLLLFNSMSCNHCMDPACLNGCPTESYIKFDNGIVFHDDEACIGCQYCTWNCPYGVPTYHEERHIVTKCHMCHERLDVGQSPACVQACPAGAIEIETFRPDEWLEEAIDEVGNMPDLVDARMTNSTTRFTLPKEMPQQMEAVDAFHIKPAHKETPLVFMTVLTQMGLGAFLATLLTLLYAGVAKQPLPWQMVAVALLPVMVGLPLSSLHLGRPIKAMRAFKNFKRSWLSREALALTLFLGGITCSMVALYAQGSFVISLLLFSATAMVGIYGIHAQAMIYRIGARPAWNRMTTNLTFFSTAYLGVYALSIGSYFFYEPVVLPLLTLGLLVALTHAFFTFESRRTLQTSQQNSEQMQKSATLYFEQFIKIKQLRDTLFIVGALALPLLSSALYALTAHEVTVTLLGVALLLSLTSELCERFMFYSTVVPLQMAGGFFVGKQR